MNINIIELRRKLEDWIIEDMPYGDISSDSIFDDGTCGSARIIAKEEGVVCGLFLGEMIYRLIDPEVRVSLYIEEGQVVESGQLIGIIEGPHGSVLKGERLFLNLLQRLSGVATMSHHYASEVEDLPVRIVDTRKTTPGLRSLEKYAVVTGGCHNHRFSLSDAVMLKDNHIKAAGGIKAAVGKIRKTLPHTTKIEVEAENLEMVKEAVAVRCDIIMLDNMTNEQMKEAVDFIRREDSRIVIEASGNMTVDRIRPVAELGVDIISVGALTHSVKAMDISVKY